MSSNANKPGNPEILGTAWIAQLFARCGRLSPKVTEGDRGVSWDGCVEAYGTSGPNHAKDDYLGEIALQVKSEQKLPEGEDIKYSVKVSDVRNYGTNSPTLYLVVRIGKDGMHHEAYYHVFRRGDYEILPLRFDGQQTFTFGFDALPTSPSELEALVLELIEEKREGEVPANVPPIYEAPKNLFLYNAEAIGFFGRGDEMRELGAFLDAEAPFLWWGIAAPGGAGKSRLAFEFQKTLDPDVNGWQSHTLRLSDYDDLNGLIERYHTPLLLVADYAQMHIQSLARLMAEQHDRDTALPRLRLLLLERDGGEEGGIFPWERQLLESVDGAHVRETRLRAVLHLQHLSDDALMGIMRAYAEALHGKEPILDPLPDGKEEELLERLSVFDEGQNRALYAMLLTNAAMHNPGKRNWSLQELLDMPLDREEKRLRYAVASLACGKEAEPDQQLLKACRQIQLVATALGSAGDLAYEDIEGLCRDELGTLEEHGYDPQDALWRVGLVTVRDDEGYVSAIRPDILGEYAILRFLMDCAWPRRHERDAFFSTVLRRIGLLAPSFQRLFRDHRSLLDADQFPIDRLLPKKLPLDDALITAYSFLLIEVLSYCPRTKQWAHVVGLLKMLVERVGDETERGAAFSNVGYALNAMGRHAEALDNYERALEATERALGPDHPDTATSLNNVGYALNAMGRHAEALGHLERALAIANKSLGANHPNTVLIRENVEILCEKIGEDENE